MSILFLAAPALAATLQVGPSQPYATVQAAIDAAADGDVIAIDPGTYSGPVVAIGRNLVLAGAGADLTVIAGAGGAALQVVGGRVVVEGLTLDGEGLARALEVSASAEVTLRQATATGGAAGALVGGTVLVDVALLTAIDAVLEGGGSVTSGGVVANDHGDLVLTGSTVVRGGRAGTGGGVFVDGFVGTASLVVDGAVRFEDNRADGGNGGALAVKGVDGVAIDGATFVGNGARLGGAVHVQYPDTVTVTGCTFDVNDADGGGALYVASPDAAIVVDLSTFTGNTAADLGGAIFAEVDTIDITDSAFTDNRAEWVVGTVPVVSGDFWFDLAVPDGTGGALFAWSSSGVGTDTTIADSTFSGNSATGNGGAVATYDTSGHVLDRVDLLGNTATSGGALALARGVTATVRDAVLADNTATSTGGAIYGDISFSYVERTRFERNVVGPGGVGGGALFADLGFLDVTDSVFLANEAPEGGAILLTDDGFTEIRSSAFEANVADDGSVLASLTEQDEIVFVGSTICGNTGAGAALALWSNPSDGLVDLRGTAIFANTTAEVVRIESDATVVRNVHLVGNVGGAQVHGDDLEWRNVLTAFNGGALALSASAFGVDTRGHALYWRNDQPLVDVVATDVFADPLLLDATAGSCDPARLFPAAGSPAIDGGDPVLKDLDGSVSDIGAFGGDEPLRFVPDPAFDCAPLVAWYTDADLDGLGSGPAQHACTAPVGAVSAGGDCDDANPAVGLPATAYVDADGDGFGGAPVAECAPVAPTVAGDGDCDDGDAVIGPATPWYADTDHDGYGAGAPVVQCEPPVAHVLVDGDCDDGDPTLNPDTVWYADADADGWGDPADVAQACLAPPGHVGRPDDCDDADPAVHPGAVWYADTDHDGYGDPAGASVVTCDPGWGWSLDATDCDPTDPDEHPDATWYLDADLDGAGDPSVVLAQCEQPAGHVARGDDCDDADPAVFPETVWYPDDDADGYGRSNPYAVSCEAPPGSWALVDGDCDDADPLRNPATIWAPDADADGFGDASLAVVQCQPVPGAIPDATDCDDADATVNPETVWYADADADGFGDVDAPTTACEAPGGHVADATDCDDGDAAAYPGAAWYADADGDGFGAASVDACAGAHAVPVGGDCDDADPAVHPDAADPPDDGIDGDCDGADPSQPEPKAPEEEPQDPEGCGCASAGGGAGGLPLLLALGILGLRRRPRR